MVITDKRYCLECSSVLLGREDKKFCSDSCRNNFNNRLKKDENNYIRNINNVLRKNRRILFELNKGEKSKAHRDKLLTAGFNFNYYTNIFETKNGNKYTFCYDQGYIALGNDYFGIVKRKEYVR